MAEPTPAPGMPPPREDWIGKVRKAAGALDGFADRSENKAAIEPLRELAEACRWAASRLTVENPAALPVAAPPAVTQETLDGVTVAGARAFWHAKDVEAQHEALRVEVMTVVSDPHLTWPQARAKLIAALGGPNG